MTGEIIKNVLKDFGLTNKEIEIYIFLAKHGVLKGGEIAKQSKTPRAQVYRILKTLQSKGLVESTLEYPTRFVAIPFEKTLNLYVKTKKEEVAFIERTKKDLLEDWKKINKTKLKPPLEKFVIIEGTKKIYLRILQMIKETKNQLSSILTIKGLVRGEQFGVFDAAYNHPLKSKIKFQFLTELASNDLKAIKLLKKKLEPGLDLKARNADSSFVLLPRMVIRDNAEILFFVSPKSDMFRTEEDETCLLTNCKSLVQTLREIFVDLWRDSINIDEGIVDLETGKFQPKPLLNKGAAPARNYDEALIEVKEQTRSLPLLAAQLTRIEHSLPKMVGREEECRQLEEYAKRALEGKGNTIIICGEVGIGKTRLINEFIPYAKSHNFKVLEYRALNESTTPLLPFREILRDFFDISKYDSHKVRRKKISTVIKKYVPHLNQAIPIVDNIVAGLSITAKNITKNKQGIDPSNLKSLIEIEDTLSTLSQLFSTFSEKLLIMLFIDDLHLADTASLKLFQNLAGTIQKSNLILVGAYCQEAITITADEADHPFLNFLQRMNRYGLYHKIELKRLNKEDCSCLIKNILDFDDNEFSNLIFRETEGNPFFILETLRLLISQKHLIKKDGRWKLEKNIKELEIPLGIFDVLTRRINKLNEEERDILEFASVIGNEFSSDLIEVITGPNRLVLLRKLNRIERKYQLIHSFDGKYRFDHSKIREVLYQAIAPELRREYHSIIAKHLEEVNKDRLEEVLNDLAYHYYRSVDAKKGVPHLLRAGKEAWKELAVFEAIRNYTQALEMMSDDEDWKKERTRTLESQGSIYAIINQHEKANKCYENGIANSDDKIAKSRMRKKIRRKKTVEKTGMKLEYFVYSEGDPTIIFIDALNIAYFTPQVNYFSKNHKIVTMNTLGIWEAQKLPGDFTIDLYTDDLRTIIDDLQDSNIFLVGVAMGGVIAINYVTKYPGKVSKLSLSATSPKPTRTFLTDDQKKSSDTFWAKAVKFPSWGLRTFYERMLPGPETERLREWSLDIVEKYPPEITLMNWKIFCEADVSALLGKINIPTLIVQGEKDPLPMDAAKYMSDKIPGSQFYVIENARFVSIFEAEKYNRILEEFMNTGKVIKN